jgi:hypothetical protein
VEKPKVIEEIPVPAVEKEPTKKRWLQMGAELEGSWIKKRVTVAAEVRGAKAVDDHSVHIGHGDPGEIVTRPHESLDSLIKDITHLWPDTVDVSCGFHLHASFTPLDGSILTSEEFYSYFKKQWAKWGKDVGLERNHEFWSRLRGDNKFAKDRFVPSEQLSKPLAVREARYTMLNWFAWAKHGTVECRLLPMFQDKQIAISAVHCLSEIYNSWLNNHGFRSISMESNATMVGEEAIETYNYVMPDITPSNVEFTGKMPRLLTGPDVYYAIDGAMDAVLPYKKDTGKVQA